MKKVYYGKTGWEVPGGVKEIASGRVNWAKEAIADDAVCYIPS